jgi:hypothetical protein
MPPPARPSSSPSRAEGGGAAPGADAASPVSPRHLSRQPSGPGSLPGRLMSRDRLLESSCQLADPSAADHGPRLGPVIIVQDSGCGEEDVRARAIGIAQTEPSVRDPYSLTDSGGSGLGRAPRACSSPSPGSILREPLTVAAFDEAILQSSPTFVPTLPWGRVREDSLMDGSRRRRTKDPVRKAWYARHRQRRFARWLGFPAPEVPRVRSCPGNTAGP